MTTGRYSHWLFELHLAHVLYRSSVAHGTPPLIQRQNYDVPLPHTVLGEHDSDAHKHSSATFLHLCQLSQILGDLLPHVYALRPGPEHVSRQIRRLECALDEWQSALPSYLDMSIEPVEQVNGASSLHFCFLSLHLLLCRVSYKVSCMYVNSHLDQGKLTQSENAQSSNQGAVQEEKLFRLAMLREAASTLTNFVSSLRPFQLSEFWLPYTAHLLVYATTVLLRCLLEAVDLATKTACAERLVKLQRRLRLASDEGWDLADFCLERCSDPIAKIARAMGITAEPEAAINTPSGNSRTAGSDSPSNPTLTLPSDFYLPLDSLDYTFDSLWDAAL